MRRRAHTILAVGLAAISAVAFKPALAFDCAPTHCPQLESCAEARYKLYVCGHTERDADNDGIPCENLCGTDRATFEARSIAQWPKHLPFFATPRQPNALEFIPPARAAPVAPQGLACASKRRCAEMNSCEEAQFYLRSCGVRSLDRDRDGVACNSLCGSR